MFDCSIFFGPVFIHCEIVYLIDDVYEVLNEHVHEPANIYVFVNVSV